MPNHHPLHSRSGSSIGRLLSTDTALPLTFQLVVEQKQCLLIGSGRTLNREYSFANVMVRVRDGSDGQSRLKWEGR